MSKSNPYAAPKRQYAKSFHTPVEETEEKTIPVEEQSPPVEEAGNTQAVSNETNSVEEVPDGNIKEVLAWVDNDKERAQLALDKELEGDERVTLVRDLKEIIE